MKALAVVAVLLAAAAGAYLATDALEEGGDSSGPRERPRPDARTLLDALLDRRAEALEAADADAYAGTATGRQRALDHRLARRARRVGLEDVTLEIEAADVDADRATLRVKQGYRVAGIRGRFASTRTIRAVRTRQGWRVRAVAGARRRAPWEVAAQRRTRTPHFVVLAPPGIDVTVLHDALEAGYARIEEVIRRGKLRRRYLVQVAADAGQARALTETIRGIAGLAALTDSEIRQEGPAERVSEVLSQRLLVPWPSFAALDPDQRVTVIAHELTHAAVARATSGRTPAWLVEGFAMYISDDNRVEEAAQRVVSGRGGRRQLSLTGLAHPESIARLDGDAQAAAYAYSSAAAHYIAEHYGGQALLDLYDVFNQESLTGSGPALADAATRRVLRRPLRRLEIELRRWIVDRAVLL